MKSFHIGNLIVVCLVAAMLIAGSGDPRASAAPTATAPAKPNRRIAFTLESGIYVINADGTGLGSLAIYPDDKAANFPNWSPDGKRLIYSANEMPGFYVINADGTGKRHIQVPTYALPNWSPDGKQFAVGCSKDNNKTQICLLNTDGSDLRILNGTDTAHSHPTWSPDGKKLAFASDHDGNDEVYVMAVDGSGRVNLTNHPARDWDPIWSPDGTKIAFLSDRDVPKSEFIYMASNIYVMDSDGKNLIRLTNNPLGDYGAVWSPDGKRIAFLRRVKQDDSYVHVMNADGSNQVECGGDYFAWSPDGQKLALVIEQDTYINIVNVQDFAGPDRCNVSNAERLNARTSKTRSEYFWGPIAWSKQ